MNTPHRIVSLLAHRVGIAAGLALAALCAATAPAQALYEFATRDGDCPDQKIDRVNDGQDLRLPLGTSRVVLWGYAMDTERAVLNDLVVSGVGDTDVRVVERRTGDDNSNGPCHVNMGSLVVDITNGPATNTQNFRKKLRFRLNGFAGFDVNAIARVPISVRRFPRPTASYAAGQTLDTCLSPDTEFLLNNQTLRIRLPPGHQSAQSNCQFSVRVRLTDSEDARVDVDPGLHVTLAGAPAFVTLQIPPGGACGSMNFGQCDVTLQFDEFQVRQLTTQSNSNIRFRQPNGTQSNAIRLAIIPNLACGFAADPVLSPDRIPVGDAFDALFRIAGSCPDPQQIYFTMNRADCFDLGAFPDAPGIADSNVRRLPQPIAPGATTATITLRALLNPPSGCAASAPDSTSHKLKAFFPGADSQVCPPETCRTSTIRIFRPL
jgi:hypothetical protein